MMIFDKSSAIIFLVIGMSVVNYYCIRMNKLWKNIGKLAPKSDYVVYTDVATLPTLYMGMNLLTHEIPSFMYLSRKNTINEEVLKNIAPHVTMMTNEEEIKNKIAEINTQESNATFTYYVNDLRVSKAWIFFYSQGISPDRVKVVMIVDGTKSYVDFKNVYGTGSIFKRLMDRTIKEYKILETLQKPYKVLTENYFFDDSKGVWAGFWLIPTIMKNTEFWLQWPELLNFRSNKLFSKFIRLFFRSDKSFFRFNIDKYLKVDAIVYYDSLTKSEQDNFIKLMNLDKRYQELGDKTISEVLDYSSKPNIIITGTKYYDSIEKIRSECLDVFINKVKQKYGDGYNYFYKGHPAEEYLPSDELITILPSKIPMEGIIWVYGSKIQILGGYESSLYINIPKYINKFFFMIDDRLLAPLDELYDKGLLGEVSFFRII